jgi:hypothetical protein
VSALGGGAYRTISARQNARVGDIRRAAYERHTTRESLYSCRSSLSLDATMDWVWLSTVRRYRARLEQWIVASLCKRNADGVLR